MIGALFDLEAQRSPQGQGGGEVALDNHLERVTAKALMFLVLSPSTAKLASNSALRRAAIDLGRTMLFGAVKCSFSVARFD